MIKLFKHNLTVIASVAWQSFTIELETNRLPRHLVPRNDNSII